MESAAGSLYLTNSAEGRKRSTDGRDRISERKNSETQYTCVDLYADELMYSLCTIKRSCRGDGKGQPG